MVKSKNHDFLKSRTKEVGTGFFIPEARQAFTQLRQEFVKDLILHHFNSKSHIRIKTDASSYAIGGVLSQLASETRLDEIVTKDNLG